MKPYGMQMEKSEFFVKMAFFQKKGSGDAKAARAD
jgi:hypothetical protein